MHNIFNHAKVIGKPRFHRWRYAQYLVDRMALNQRKSMNFGVVSQNRVDVGGKRP
jgi:hypothetical protein